MLEFKVTETDQLAVKADEALTQMREEVLAGKYRTLGQSIHLLAVVLDRQQRHLGLVRAERV